MALAVLRARRGPLFPEVETPVDNVAQRTTGLPICALEARDEVALFVPAGV